MRTYEEIQRSFDCTIRFASEADGYAQDDKSSERLQNYLANSLRWRL
jgi:hypothetical protein